MQAQWSVAYEIASNNDPVSTQQFMVLKYFMGWNKLLKTL